MKKVHLRLTGVAQVNTNVITSVIHLIHDPLSYTDCTISLFRL